MVSYSNGVKYFPISFYNFLSFSKTDIMNDIIPSCRKLLQNNFVKGTLLIADEGYNGQMIVPEQTSLITLQNDLRNLLNDRTLDFNVGPLYANVNGRLPFRKLIVRYKKSIITDGFQNRRGTTISFGQGSGRELNADDWHHALSSSDPSLVIDVRNYYESERGTFKNSIPLNTSTYSESWDALDKIIDGKDKDTPIYTFCTGIFIIVATCDSCKCIPNVIIEFSIIFIEVDV